MRIGNAADLVGQAQEFVPGLLRCQKAVSYSEKMDASGCFKHGNHLTEGFSLQQHIGFSDGAYMLFHDSLRHGAEAVLPASPGFGSEAFRSRLA